MKLGEIDTAYALKRAHTELLYNLTLIENGRLALLIDGEKVEGELIEAIKPALRRKLAEQLGEVITKLRALGVTID